MDICEQTENDDETSDDKSAETFLNNTASQSDGTSSFELWKKGNLGICIMWGIGMGDRGYEHKQ